jgi:prevent-host-death family protein
MVKVWQLQEAKSKFSELVDNALKDGPQIVTRHGDEVAVVLSYQEYLRLNKPETDLVEFFRASPLMHQELDLERDRSLGRIDISL